MSFLEENTKIKYPNKKPPYIVSVNKDETENFMNDILKGVSNLPSKQKVSHKFLFLKSILLGFIIFCICLFFLYTSYYFVDHVFLHKYENCRPLSEK